MNRTYKVAKSLTRGVVVTSEKASSYQGKAVKTVVAAAVAALVAGTAIAATDAEGVLKVQENKTLLEGASYSQISINDAKENTKVSGTTLTLTKQGTAVDSQPDSALFSNVKGGTFEFDSVSVKGAYAHGLYVETAKRLPWMPISNLMISNPIGRIQPTGKHPQLSTRWVGRLRQLSIL